MEEYDSKLAEYKEATAEERLNAGLLFGELTVYLAVTGGLIQVVASKPQLLYWMCIPGIVISVAFWVIAERCGDFAVAARNRAKNLEEYLGFFLYRSVPKPKIRGCTRINGTRWIFAFGFISWSFILMWGFIWD